MIVRVWRAEARSTSLEDYERFAAERSLPMFSEQPGYLGVIFTRADTDCAVITFWENRAAAEKLEKSPSYRQTVARLLESDFLVGDSSVEIFDVHGGDLSGAAAVRL